jgi:hypothetical protein
VTKKKRCKTLISGSRFEAEASGTEVGRVLGSPGENQWYVFLFVCLNGFWTEAQNKVSQN